MCLQGSRSSARLSPIKKSSCTLLAGCHPPVMSLERDLLGQCAHGSVQDAVQLPLQLYEPRLERGGGGAGLDVLASCRPCSRLFQDKVCPVGHVTGFGALLSRKDDGTDLD